MHSVVTTQYTHARRTQPPEPRLVYFIFKYFIIFEIYIVVTTAQLSLLRTVWPEGRRPSARIHRNKKGDATRSKKKKTCMKRVAVFSSAAMEFVSTHSMWLMCVVQISFLHVIFGGRMFLIWFNTMWCNINVHRYLWNAHRIYSIDKSELYVCDVPSDLWTGDANGVTYS